MSEWFAATELAGLSGMPGTVQAVNYRAKKEGWRSRARQGRGGGKEYHVSSLPEEARAALGGNPVNALPEAVFTQEIPKLVSQSSTHMYSEVADGNIARPGELEDDAGVCDGLLLAHAAGGHGLNLPEFEPPADRRDRAGEAKNLILLAKEFYLSQQKAVEQGRVQHFTLEFVSLYKEQRIALPLWVYEAVKGLSYQTIYRWEAQRAVGGVSALKRKSFEREKTMDANAEMAEFAKNLLLSFPHLNPKAIWKEVQQRYPDHCPSLPTMRRWIAEWISQHQGAFEYAVSPKDHRSRRQRAFGSYATDHYNQRWELDSTLADIIWELKDEYGDFKRFALVNGIEVYSRLGKGIACCTSNAEAIASLLRECLLDWGVPESVKTDNGKDYVSRHIVNILSNLKIHHLKSKPFNPPEKPYIERLNKTQNHSSEFLMHNRYLGHNVIAQEKIRSREFFKTKPKKKKEADQELYQFLKVRLQITPQGWRFFPQ